LPLARNDRHAGFLSIFWLWAGGNVLLTNFISGSSYALGLGFWPMLVISIAGFLLGLAFCSWDSQRSARYGIDEMVSLRPTFGYHGSIYGVLILVGVNFGWVGILASLAGSAMKLVVQDVGSGLAFAGDYTLYALGVGIVLPLIIIMFSQKAAFQLSKITVPILLAFVVYILVRLFTGGFWTGVVTQPGDGSTSWMGAFEIIFAFTISWFPYLGSWNRFGMWIPANFLPPLRGFGRPPRPEDHPHHNTLIIESARKPSKSAGERADPMIKGLTRASIARVADPDGVVGGRATR
jgi:purine-cytosine permease-like protein